MRERTDSTRRPRRRRRRRGDGRADLARAYREKFGGDHIDDVHAAIAAYRERIGWRGSRTQRGRPTIVFIGFMAAGKTRGALARPPPGRRGARRRRADSRSALGEPIAAFFAREGEAEFRAAARSELVLGAARPRRRSRSALGGGAVEAERVREALAIASASGATSTRRRRLGRGVGRADRPLAADRDAFARRFAAREPALRGAGRRGPARRRRGRRRGGRALDRRPARAPGAADGLGRVGGRLLPGGRRTRARSGCSDRAPAPAPFPRAASASPTRGAGRRRRRCRAARRRSRSRAASRAKTMAEAERVLAELAAAGARRDDS